MKSCPICVPGHIQDTSLNGKMKKKKSCPICVPRHIQDTSLNGKMKKKKSCPKCVPGHIQDTFVHGKMKTEMCPRTHPGHICEQKEEEKEKLSKMCPRTHSGHICEIREEIDKKLSESCPKTTKDNIMDNDENMQVCNRTLVSNEESNANCENINTEKEKLTICNQNTELSSAIPDVNLNRNSLLIKRQESRRNNYNHKRARRKKD